MVAFYLLVLHNIAEGSRFTITKSVMKLSKVLAAFLRADSVAVGSSAIWHSFFLIPLLFCTLCCWISAFCLGLKFNSFGKEFSAEKENLAFIFGPESRKMYTGPEYGLT